MFYLIYLSSVLGGFDAEGIGTSKTPQHYGQQQLESAWATIKLYFYDISNAIYIGIIGMSFV